MWLACRSPMRCSRPSSRVCSSVAGVWLSVARVLLTCTIRAQVLKAVVAQYDAEQLLKERELVCVCVCVCVCAPYDAEQLLKERWA